MFNICLRFSPAQNFQCAVPHEGKHLLDVVVPIHIDQLFTLLFTSSKFYLDFHAKRKTSDLTQTPWTHNPLDNSKSRVVSLTMALGQTMGPKTAQVTETQVLNAQTNYEGRLRITRPDVEVTVVYCDRMHMC